MTFIRKFLHNYKELSAPAFIRHRSGHSKVPITTDPNSKPAGHEQQWSLYAENVVTRFWWHHLGPTHIRVDQVPDGVEERKCDQYNFRPQMTPHQEPQVAFVDLPKLEHVEEKNGQGNVK